MVFGKERAASSHQHRYNGCINSKPAKKANTIKGIYSARNFYGVSGDSISLREPQFLSTLYWKPGIIIDKDGETTFSFLTGDITGQFRIVIQGVGEKDVIYGEADFMVK